MRTKPRHSALIGALALFVVVLGSLPGWAADTASGPFVFGPKLYTKTQAGQEAFTDTFTATLADRVNYKLIIRNGDQDKKDRVTAAQIFLNGAEVVSEADFNKMVEHLAVDVTIKESNELVITLKGEVGTMMQLAIVRRPEETGFLWGGLLSSSSLLLQGGTFTGIDAYLHLKAITAEGPMVAAVAVFGEEGKRLYVSKPLFLHNHAGKVYFIEEILKSLADQTDQNWDELLKNVTPVSVEVYWVSRHPSRAVGALTWTGENEGNKRSTNLPLELIYAGRVACPKCEEKPGDAAASLADGFSTADILAAADEMKGLALR